MTCLHAHASEGKYIFEAKPKCFFELFFLKKTFSLKTDRIYLYLQLSSIVLKMFLLFWLLKQET